jgi:hypothetical protein
MDPYLEGPRWQGVHAQLIAEIARQLAPLLFPRYAALVAERVVVEMPEDVPPPSSSRYPDVAVLEAASGPSGGIAATTVAPAPLRLATVVPEAVPHWTVEIRDAAEERLVTAIEVLSPTNKRGNGREEYLAKRNQILRTETHLIEIDLLRRGRRVPMQEPLPPAPYFVFLSRGMSRPVTEVWPIAFQQPLPTVPVPLLPGDADVPLDVQRALNTIYDLLNYRILINYAHAPQVPLTPQEQAWADDRIRAFRSGGG